MLSLEQKKELYRKYGTTRPDEEYEEILNPLIERYEKYSIRELVDSVWVRIRELETQKERIGETRKFNLKRKAEKEKQIEECRNYNLLVRDLKMSGIEVKRR